MTSSTYCIASHSLLVVCADELDSAQLLPSFAPFVLPLATDSPLLTMHVEMGTPTDFTSWDEIGQFDCGGANHGVYRDAEGHHGFEISLPGADHHIACTMMADSDFSHCRATLVNGSLRQQQFGLNNALMMAYAFAAATLDTLLIHASVIRKDGYGYLFTAPSGTGKSTHTHLWYKNIPDCDLMNDDNPVIRLIDGKAYIFGSPWSGKTPCYRNISAPIGAITRLEQRPANEIRRMGALEAFTTLLPAVSSMKWDRRVYMGICQTISNMIKTTPVYWLGCLPDAEAALLSYQTIAVK